MKLRYFQYYDKNGKDSELELQYFDEEANKWKPVNFIRVFYLDVPDAMYDEDLC
jgi:hypothetical protein